MVNFSLKDKIPKQQNFFINKNNLQNKFIVQYSGNIGFSHNVEFLIDIANELREHDDICFIIIGRGAKKNLLKNLVKKSNLENCIFLPFQKDSDFIYSLSSADLGFVILNDKIDMGSVPSKLFNLMSLGIPSIYVGSTQSQLKDYAIKYNCAKFFTIDEIKSIKKFIIRMKEDSKFYKILSSNSTKASLNFNRKNADDLVSFHLNII